MNSNDSDFSGLKQLFTNLADPRVQVVTDHQRRFIPNQFRSDEPGDVDEFYIAWIDKLISEMDFETTFSEFVLKVHLSNIRPNQNATFETTISTLLRINLPDGPDRRIPYRLTFLLGKEDGPFGMEELSPALTQTRKLASYPKFMPLFFVRTAYDRNARQTVKIETPVYVRERFNFTNFAVDSSVRGPYYKIKMFIVHFQ